jgi:signal peptidase I
MDSTASPGEAASPPVSTSSERRVAAPLVGLLFGPLAYIAIGRWQRAAVWYAIEVALGALAIAAAFLPVPKVMWLALLAFEVTRVVIAIDAGRLGRIHPLPRARLLAVIGVGVVLFYGILEMQVRAHLVEAFKTPSQSMYPSIQVGDHIFAKKVGQSYRRGDVVVFQFPLDHSIDYVKRIVGVGGDAVAIQDGQLIINGVPVEHRRLDEPCAFEALGSSCALWEESFDGRKWTVALDDGLPRDLSPVTVPPGQYFVLGDNRDASSDSRMWGPVPAELVKGTAAFIYWSSSPSGVRWARINQPVR